MCHRVAVAALFVVAVGSVSIVAQNTVEPLRHVVVSAPSTAAASPMPLDLPVDPALSYKLTIGTDFHSLLVTSPLIFHGGTGGGVGVSRIPTYAEVGVDLPDGAVVSEVTFIYANCGVIFWPPRLYFGMYTPDQATFTYHVPETEGRQTTSCPGPYFVDQLTVDPPVPVDNSQNRYVAGFVFRDTDSFQLLVGVRIGYSFP